MKIKFYTMFPEYAEQFDLTDKEFMAFSVILSFSQDETSAYEGGQIELAKAVRCSKATVRRVLDSLKEKGLIKQDQIIWGNDRYRAVMQPMLKMSTPSAQNEHRSNAQNEHPYNNTNNNTNNTSCTTNNIRAFLPPTLQEVADYCELRNNEIDPQSFIDYYTSNGWMVGKTRMKDWTAAVRTWEKRSKKDKQHVKPNSTTRPSDSVSKMRERHASVNEAIVAGGNIDFLG